MEKFILEKLKREAKKAIDSKDQKERIEHLSKAFSLFSKETQILEESYKELRKKFEKTNIELIKKVDEIKQVTNYLNNILKHISQGIIFIDKDGIVTTFNIEAANILEKEINHVLYKNFWENFSDTVFGFSIKKSLQFKLSHPINKICFSDNKKEIEISTVFIKEKRPYQGIIITIKDVTKIKQLEMIANRNDRLKELGQMAATVAHEIRNPLGGIRGYASLLYRDLEHTKHLQNMAKYIIDGAKSLERIVNNVLHFSKPLNMQMEYVNISALIKEIYKFIKVDPTFPKNIFFNLHIPDKFIFAYADKELLKSAIFNLIINAFQAIKENGKISIFATKNNDICAIEISDNGTGIEEQDLENIFSPFFTTKQKGNGLGLAETFKIIRAHFGNIDVRSKINFGSTFTITLPMRKKNAYS